MSGFIYAAWQPMETAPKDGRTIELEIGTGTQGEWRGRFFWRSKSQEEIDADAWENDGYSNSGWRNAENGRCGLLDGFASRWRPIA